MFKRFCDDKGFPASPAHPIHVGMYLSILIDEGKSSNVVSSAFYAIKWLHNINDLVDPTESAIVKNILESVKRLNSRPVLKKDVISREMLIQLCDFVFRFNRCNCSKRFEHDSFMLHRTVAVQ